MQIGQLTISVIAIGILTLFAFVIERRGYVSRWTVIGNFVLLSGVIFPEFAYSI